MPIRRHLGRRQRLEKLEISSAVDSGRSANFIIVGEIIIFESVEW